MRCAVHVFVPVRLLVDVTQIAAKVGAGDQSECSPVVPKLAERTLIGGAVVWGLEAYAWSGLCAAGVHARAVCYARGPS